MPTKASSSEEQTVALDNTSSAPLALAVATADGKLDGATRYNSESIIFFMALAAAPIFPGSVVFTMTILTLSKLVKV
jgi:hypothetical protein